MNCPDVQALLSAYYDGELAGDRESRLSDHLDKCSDCAKELAEFKNLSNMATALSTPVPPEHIWSQLEEQLDRQSNDERPITQSVDQSRSWFFPVRRQFALAATVLVAAGISWLTYQSWPADGGQNQFTAEFGQYLDEFRNDPNAAQQILLAKYEHHLVDHEHAIQRVGYRPSVADGLPEGYTLESTHVMKMPCCTCVQSICKRSDGSTLAIFEHNDEETTQWFGDRPEIAATCHDKPCCLVELKSQFAASWKHGARHITLIGVRDVAEVSDMVAWLDEQR